MGRDPTTGSWYCVDCHYESANKGDVRNHIEAKHVDTVGTSCDICGIVTKTRKAGGVMMGGGTQCGTGGQ